jgi:hypothetical protein
MDQVMTQAHAIDLDPLERRHAMRVEAGADRARRWTYATIIAFWLTTLALNVPGHLSWDSIVQLNEARSRSYGGYHPPLMSYLMMLFDSIMPGTALFLLFMQALFFGALLIVARSARRVSRWTPIIVALGCLHPFVLVYQGIVWKDVLVANLAILAFALLFAAHRRDRWQRYGLCAAGLLAAACGGLVRQNGAVALVVLCIAMLHLEFPSSSVRAFIAKIAAGAAGAVLILALASLGTTTLIRASAKAAPGNTFGMALATIMQYDIAGILAGSNQADVGFLSELGLDMRAAREDVSRNYSPERQDWLRDGEKFRTEINKLTFSQLARSWTRLTIENFGAYLRHRLAVFRQMVWPPDISRCVPLHLGIDGLTDLMTKLELPQGLRPSDRALFAYTVKFVETPLYRHGFFLVAAVMIAVILIVRHGLIVSTPAVAPLAAGILFALSWSVFSIACDVRYIYLLPLALFLSIIMLSILEAERAGARAAVGSAQSARLAAGAL